MDKDPEKELLLLQDQFFASNDAPAATLKKPSRFKRQSEADSESIKEQIPGQRVQLNIGDDQAPIRPKRENVQAISEIIEREVKYDSSLFDFSSVSSAPIPKKIDWRTKMQNKAQKDTAHGHKELAKTKPANSQQQIDQENVDKLANMSEEEIERERRELLATLDPSLVHKLMQRRSDTAAPEEDTLETRNASISSGVQCNDEDAADENLAEDEREHIHTKDCLTSSESTGHLEIHFPRPPAPPPLDPNSPNFYKDLKEKYYPTLETDPSKLAWMQTPTAAEDEAVYHQSSRDLLPGEIRFDFNADVLAPRTSRQVRQDLGLHHHADAPLAAGYTILELAHLSRSSYPAQACIAIQTLGRLMYKVGKIAYGNVISNALRYLLEEGKVEITLMERTRDRHLGVQSYATEALWLNQLGNEKKYVCIKFEDERCSLAVLSRTPPGTCPGSVIEQAGQSMNFAIQLLLIAIVATGFIVAALIVYSAATRIATGAKDALKDKNIEVSADGAKMKMKPIDRERYFDNIQKYSFALCFWASTDNKDDGGRVEVQ